MPSRVFVALLTPFLESLAYFLALLESSAMIASIEHQVSTKLIVLRPPTQIAYSVDPAV